MSQKRQIAQKRPIEYEECEEIWSKIAKTAKSSGQSAEAAVFSLCGTGKMAARRRTLPWTGRAIWEEATWVI
jgi:hypothetical protein